jgi:hypothetical protein
MALHRTNPVGQSDQESNKFQKRDGSDAFWFMKNWLFEQTKKVMQKLGNAFIGKT